ncbi:unnamed protein product [Bathycoccus prasinos]
MLTIKKYWQNVPKPMSKVRELQAMLREAENAYEKNGRRAIEKVKRYRSAPQKSVYVATRALLRSKSKGLKIQQALKFQKWCFLNMGRSHQIAVTGRNKSKRAKILRLK